MASSGINNCRDLIPYVPINFAKIMDDGKQKAHDISKWVLVPSGESSHPLEDVAITTHASTSTPQPQEPQEPNSLLLISQAIEQTILNEPVTPQQLTTRKRRLVNAQVLGYTPVSFIILPSESEANTYTVKLNKTGEQPNDPFGLNSKYNDILLGWTAETRQRPNGHCDTFYYHEKRNAECRSVADVRRFIFKGFEKLKVEVDPETNEVKEFRVEQHTKKRKAQSSSSEKEPAAKKQKGSSSELLVGNKAMVTEKPGAIAYNNLMNSDNQNKEENVATEFVVGEASETASNKRKLESSNSESSESAVKIQKSSAEEAIIESKSTPEKPDKNRIFLVMAYNNLRNLGNRHNNADKSKKVHSKGSTSKKPSNRKRFYKPSSSNLPVDPIPAPLLFQNGEIGSSKKLYAVEVVPQKEAQVSKSPSPSKLEKFDKASSSNISIDALNMPPLFQEEKSESFAADLDCYEIFPQKEADKENEGIKIVQGNTDGWKEDIHIVALRSAKNKELHIEVTKSPSPLKLEKFDKASSSNVSIDALNMPPLFQEEKSKNFAANLDCYEVFPQKEADIENEGAKIVQGNTNGKEVSAFEEKRDDEVVVGLAKNEELPTQFPYTEGNFGMSANFDPNEAVHDKKVDKEEEGSKAIHENADEEKGEEEMIVSLAKTDAVAAEFSLFEGNFGISANCDPIEAAQDKKVDKEEEVSKAIHDENAGEENNYVVEEKGEEEMFVSLAKTDAVATAFSLYEGNFGMSVNFGRIEAAHDKKVDKEEEGSKPIHENADQANNYVVEEKGEVEMIVNQAKADEIAAEFSLYGGNFGMSVNFDPVEAAHDKKVEKEDEGSKAIHENADQANNYVVEEKGEVEMIVNQARADEIAAEFSLYGGNHNQVMWGSRTLFELGGNSGSIGNFGMHEVVPQKEMDKAKEGAKTVNEATDGNKGLIPIEENGSKEERKVEEDVAQTLVNIDKFDIFSHHEVSFLDDQHVKGFYDPNAFLLGQIEHNDFGIENHELLFNHGFKHL
ncbi:PREDICTED: uncharacterized protein LOC109233762 [Nicotiana attenuata]|uniref:Uncharacterized protein n=1 Tax=Nicotiana attenuata TaxID=49451 RepID=A0A1J6HZA7_NICAT|nr:PREDICTED: uncharacterized protein LOC109233762 [Nicotiana attenuata]OIS98156.1 hypothetical protein A4A49_13048 [Nicotiana attenuata]